VVARGENNNNNEGVGHSDIIIIITLKGVCVKPNNNKRSTENLVVF
jgi:hypothetical protein